MRALATALTLVAGLLLVGSAPLRASEPEAPSPRLKILTPRGGQTKSRVVEIKGEIAGIEVERLWLVLNGVPLFIPHDAAAFATKQVLAPGWNTIRVVADEKGGPVSDEVAVYAMVPGKDLRVTLIWDTPATDIDLWVTGPDGEKVFYRQKQGKAGGTLDTDVTTGFGPETYTQARAQPGTYRVEAHYYGGGPPTRVAVTVTRGEGTETESRRVFRGVLLRPKDIVQVGEFTIAR